ncbi:MAG TPA: hypothetical protein VFW87_02245, partial [Pirellulales bacterium]|nr:hypothetical protein [Pirellulales bacterium]
MMSPLFSLSGLSRRLSHSSRSQRLKSRRRQSPRAKSALRSYECLERRDLLTYVATFGGGILTIQNTGVGNDTAVLKEDAASGEILLDATNSGNFVDTGANINSITGPIQISAGNATNSTFIIDNNAGGFFEPTSFFPTFNPAAPLPTVIFDGGTGVSAFKNNLTVRGRAGIADTFEVDNATLAQSQLTLTEPITSTTQQFPNQLLVQVNNMTGSLNLDGIDGTSGGDQLVINGAANDIWQDDGNVIQGPAATQPSSQPPKPLPPGTQPIPKSVITYSNLGNVTFNLPTGGTVSATTTGTTISINGTGANTIVNGGDTDIVNLNQPLAFGLTMNGIDATGAPVGQLNVNGSSGNDAFYVDNQTIALDANSNDRIQPGGSFNHLGADIQYTGFTTMQVAGMGGDNTFTVQVPPLLQAPFLSPPQLPATTVFLGANGPLSPNVTPGTDLLRVFGNDPGPNYSGADTITVSDFASTGTGGTTTGGALQMFEISGVVVYGLGGNDALTNASTRNVALGIKPIPALLI